MWVSKARRQGCDVASGAVLVCLDAHMTFDPSWLDRMLAHVESGALLCSAFWNYERTVCHCFGADFTWCAKSVITRLRFTRASSCRTELTTRLGQHLRSRW